jgi:hypothetical protein
MHILTYHSPLNHDKRKGGIEALFGAPFSFEVLCIYPPTRYAKLHASATVLVRVMTSEVAL